MVKLAVDEEQATVVKKNVNCCSLAINKVVLLSNRNTIVMKKGWHMPQIKMSATVKHLTKEY